MKCLPALICMFLLPLTGKSQLVSNYWSHQFGSNGLLLNGAVVANVSDETAIFYNPAGFGLSHHTGLSVSLLTPSYSVISSDKFLGDETELGDSHLGLAPGLVAASFQPFDTEKFIVGATTFARSQAGIRLDGRTVVDYSDDKLFVTNVDFTQRSRETWVGFSASYLLSSRLSIGVSQFISLVSNRTRIGFSKELVAKNNPANLIAGWRNDLTYAYSYQGGFITKVGLAADLGGFKLGLTYTSPTRGPIRSSASYSYDDRRTRADGQSTVFNNNDDASITDISTPWSAALGLSFDIGDRTVSLSAEYFQPIKRYTLIRDLDDPFNGLSTNPTAQPINFDFSAREIINMAIGVEHRLNRNYDVFYGFRTDLTPNNTLEIGDELSYPTVSPSIYHVSGGIEYYKNKSSFSIGLDYGYGQRSGSRQLTDLSTLDSNTIFTLGGKDVVDIHIHVLTLFITYDL